MRVWEWPKWEYEVLRMFDEIAFKTRLNQLGQDGWELMHAASQFVPYRPLPSGYAYITQSATRHDGRADGCTEWYATLRRRSEP